MNDILASVLISSGIVLVLELIRRISKSSCSHINLCCGLVQVRRNIQAENSIKKFNIEHNNYESDKNNMPINIV